jgi:dihydrofolate reductase
VAKLVFEMNQSLDGYVDHMKIGPPHPAAFHHFIERVRSLSGMLYGRRLYEVMRYWDDELPDWDAEDREFAAAWSSQPKWVVSRSLQSLGPNATLINQDVETAVRDLKAKLPGDIAVGGPELAASLASLELLDEYRLYVHPVVLGSGKPFFAAPRPRLRLVATDPIPGDVIRLTYAPA